MASPSCEGAGALRIKQMLLLLRLPAPVFHTLLRNNPKGETVASISTLFLSQRSHVPGLPGIV